MGTASAPPPNGLPASPPTPRPRAKLGEIIVHLGFATQEQVNAAIARQKSEGRRLGEVLIAEGVLTREQMGRAMAYRLGVEYVTLGDKPDPAVSALLDDRNARRYKAVPVRLDEQGRLVVAMADPSDIFAVDDLRILTGREVVPALSTEEEIQSALRARARIDEFVAGLAEEAEADEVDERSAPSVAEIREAVDDAPVVRLVNSVIARAVEEGASDIHFEPQNRDMLVRFRVDGVLRQVTTVPQRMSNGVVSRLKIMADIDIAERRVPQDGRVGMNVHGRSLDLRVASLPTVHGESVVIRILDRSNVLLQLDELGFTKETLARYERCYRKPYGAVLVTGPTGSGKSTTLYGTLNQLNSPEKKIITVEDPVEYRLAGINQMQVNPKAGLTFANGLRSILRSDPDIVMIGEIRDKETAQIAVESALTGHLVLATIHTNDSAGAITRLTEMGVEPFLTSSAICGILAQRLARRLCVDCKGRETITHAEIRDRLGSDIWLPQSLPDPVAIQTARGCPRCAGTGYRGRIGVYEMLVMSEPLKRLAVEHASADEMRTQARREGMRTLLEDGLLKVLQGQTSMEELARTVG